MFLSVFDIYKIGIGPSSSHTMGPMTAAGRFLDELLGDKYAKTILPNLKRLKVTLHGSLAYTGIGHGTDRAVLLGLAGCLPDTIDPDQADEIIAATRQSNQITPPGHAAYDFNPDVDLVFDRKTPLPGHANGMMFMALDGQGNELCKRAYFSIGGGFVVDEAELAEHKSASRTPAVTGVPYPFHNAAEMLEMAAASGKSVADIKRANEEAHIDRQSLNSRLDQVWGAMDRCVDRGISLTGTMPGGLNVKRRAKAIHDKLQEEWKRNRSNPLLANDWLAVYAMAVNEENAAGGRVVTSPTNGAAGVIPAVLRYYMHFHEDAGPEGIRDFLLTSAAIGGIIKYNASISGAEVGCQGEVGSASAMAAAGLAEVLGGTPTQVENAAEIALEHHLGMTCDPVGGLVQIPCIERNALGAVKAVTAASLALKGDGTHFVPLDACIETMRQTGIDMSDRYKETSEGGLAVNLVGC